MNKKNKLILALGAIVLAVPFLNACNNSIDYVSQCHLSDYLPTGITSYENHTFLDDGIGLVTIQKYVDGDTTHFLQVEDGTQRLVKARYLGIDTPESTGQIEPWGKKASAFTKSKLETAQTIVLTTDVTEIGSAATVDSTGSRYKAFVWISTKANCPVEDLKLLNLWIVQEGYSTGKGISDSTLESFFTNADLQAQEEQIHIWAGDDPDFYTGPATPTTLQELAETFEEDGSESSFNGASVSFEGIVYKLSGDYDAYLYDTDTEGNKYGIYVFAGYKSYSPLRTLGNRLKVIGTYTIYYGNPQLTNVSYNAFLPEESTDMSIISTGNQFTIDTMTINEINTREAVNMVYTINNLTVYDGYTEIDSTTLVPSGALTLRCNDANQNQISVRIPEDVWAYDSNNNRADDWADFDGSVINITGAINFYAPDEENPNTGYYQIKLCASADLVVVS